MKTKGLGLAIIAIFLIAVSSQAQDAKEADPVQRVIDAYHDAQEGDNEVELLQELGESLSAYQDPRLLEALVPLLESGDAEIRKAALMSISSGTAQDPAIMDATLLDQVGRMAGEEIDPQAQMAALEILVRDEAFAAEAQTSLAQLTQEQTPVEEDPVQRAMDAYHAAQQGDNEVEMLQELGESLSAYQDPRLLEALGSSLESDAPDIRKAALASISSGTAQDPTMLDAALLDRVRLMAAEETDPQAQMAALEILARDEVFAAEAQAALAQLTQEQKPVEEDPVQRAMDAYHDAQEGDNEVEMLQELGESLSAYQDPRLLEALGSSLESDDPEIRKAALASISSGTAQDPAMLDDALLDRVRLIADEETDPGALDASYNILDAADNILEASDDVLDSTDN